MVAYTTSVTDPLPEFLALVSTAFETTAAAKLVLAKPRPADDELQRVTVRPVSLKGETFWSFVYTHQTRAVSYTHLTLPTIYSV